MSQTNTPPQALTFMSTTSYTLCKLIKSFIDAFSWAAITDTQLQMMLVSIKHQKWQIPPIKSNCCCHAFLNYSLDIECYVINALLQSKILQTDSTQPNKVNLCIKTD